MTGGVFHTGICSFGMSGKLFHAPFLAAHPGYVLAAIVERHQSESREKYPASRLYRSVEELCADPAIQLVVVNTPTHLHYNQARLALEAGKHVVVEKAFTLTVKEAEELKALAEAKGLVLSVYQNRRYDGDFRAVRAVLQKGLLGELREVQFRYDRYRPQFGGKAHKEGDLPGAGILFDLSPHLGDQALELFGLPDAVFADSWQMRDGVSAPDYFELLLYYPRLRVRLMASCLVREPGYAYILHGTKGSFLQQRSDRQEQALLAGAVPSLHDWCGAPDRPDGLLHTDVHGTITREETTSAPGNYMGFYDDLYKTLTGTGPNPVPPAEGVRNMRLLEAALRSEAEKKIVPF